MNNLDEQEIRSFSSSVEIRDGTDKQHKIVGYALVFNEPSEYMGYIETIDQRALDDVDLANIYGLYDHDYSNVLARSDSETLSLNVDEKGLYFEMMLPNTTLGKDVYENVLNGNIKGCSFGFRVGQDDWYMENGQSHRTILQIKKLTEISLTPIPAYNETSVAVRNKIQEMKHQRAKNKALFLLALTNIEMN